MPGTNPKNSVGTSEFRGLLIYVALVVLNGITITTGYFTFDIDITEAQLNSIGIGAASWAGLRQYIKNKNGGHNAV